MKTGDTQYVSYDDLYPPGPGRAEVEKYCVYCHYENYLPSRQWTREQWAVGVDLLLNVGGPRSVRHRSVIPDTPHLIAPTTIGLHPFGNIEIRATNTLSTQDRELILDYLAANFGPDSKKRALSEENDIPVNEEILGHAMYVEYYVQPNPEVDKEGFVRQVQDPHFDSKGNVWFTDRGTRNRLGRLDPRTGEITDFLMPDERDLDPHGLTIDDEDDVWWVEEFGLYLGHLDIETGKMERFSQNVDKPDSGWTDAHAYAGFKTERLVQHHVRKQCREMGPGGRESRPLPGAGHGDRFVWLWNRSRRQ